MSPLPPLCAPLCRETRELERQLRVLQRTSSGTEKQIFALRKTIRHHYRQVIYLDLAFAAENEVEQALWKYVFYKQIEELRKLLKLVTQHTHTHTPKLSSHNTATLPRLTCAASLWCLCVSSMRRARLRPPPLPSLPPVVRSSQVRVWVV